MNKNELKRAFSEYITGMIMDGTIKPDNAPDLISFIDELLDTRETYIVGKLAELVSSWETTMGDDDKSLYTLGVRRAIDVIRETDYKPINGEDYRDFKRPFDLPNEE
jgi:hypothetical protein